MPPSSHLIQTETARGPGPLAKASLGNRLHAGHPLEHPAAPPCPRHAACRAAHPEDTPAAPARTERESSGAASRRRPSAWPPPRAPGPGAVRSLAARPRLPALLGGDGYSCHGTRHSRRAGHARLLQPCHNVAREREEGVVHVLARAGRALEELHRVFIRELLALRGGDLTLGGQVALVADEDLVHHLRRIRLDVACPRRPPEIPT